MEDRKYTKNHEWIQIDGEEAIIGISDFAQEELGDIVYVELPGVGDHFDKDDTLGVIESVKASADFYSPVSGEVTAVNDKLEESPEIINQSPYEDGWIVRIKMDNPDELNDLMDESEYEAFKENNN